MDCHTPERLTFLLVHGAWHSGRVWDGVAEHLTAYGHDVHAPTLAGCGGDARPGATLDEAIDSVVDYIIDNDLSNVNLVGWSFGGLVVSQVAARVPDRIARVVFNSAFVLKDGERLYDTIPAKMTAFFRSRKDRDGLLTLPFTMFREAFVPDVDAATASSFYDAHLHPHVEAMFDTPVDMTGFNDLVADGLPVSYVHMPDDVLISFGWQNWTRFADRLAGLGTCRMIHLPDVGHEAALVDPEATARAYVLATRP